jgi:hypothetical protein
LWRGFEQMTRTRPCRRMILHFSHIGFTDGRTFTVARFALVVYGNLVVPAARLWRPFRSPLPGCSSARSAVKIARGRNERC